MSVIQDLHISLLIGECIERERETVSICEMVKTWKWYYVHNMRSAYFPINTRCVFLSMISIDLWL